MIDDYRSSTKGISTKIQVGDDVVYKIAGDTETITEEQAREAGLSHSLLPSPAKED